MGWQASGLRVSRLEMGVATELGGRGALPGYLIESPLQGLA